MADHRETLTRRSAQGGTEDSVVRRSELIISGVLRGGVILSAGVICLGVLAYYIGTPTHLVYPNGLSFPDSIPALWLGLRHADPVAIIALGLLALLATPVVRVAVSIVAFALSRDRLYVVITSLVLGILIFSLVSGIGGG